MRVCVCLDWSLQTRFVLQKYCYYCYYHYVKVTRGTDPVYENGLNELDHLQCDLQGDGDQVVVEDDEGQQGQAKVGFRLH